MTIGFFALFLFLPFCEAKETYVIKAAFLAPEGSSWMNVMRDFERELQKETDGEVKLKIYAGGVSGDEKDVIRKMSPAVQQIHAAGFTGMGMGEILPSTRVFEVPFLFQDYKEVDYVTTNLFDTFSKEFEGKGYVLLGFAEAGFVNIFSQKPIATHNDMKKAKMWSWEGDPLARAMFKAYNIVPVPVSITDVLTSLQTNLVNSFYAPPLAAIALQWHTKVKYMTDVPVNFSIGGLLVTKKKFDSIPSNHQQKLRDLSHKYAKLLVAQIREDNKKSYEVLKKSLTFVKVKDPDLKTIKDVSLQVRKELIGNLYSQELLDKVIGLLEKYRSDLKAQK